MVPAEWEVSSIVNSYKEDDLVLIAESMEELIEKYKKWKEGMQTGISAKYEDDKNNGK